jgi:hypothetical protein
MDKPAAMTIFTRLERWKDAGVISAEQCALLTGLARGEPRSVFLELNVLLYAGVLAFVAGLGWTVTTWSAQLGDLLILSVLSALFVVCFWYCFSRGPAWSPEQTPSPSLVFDYVLYLGSLTYDVKKVVVKPDDVIIVPPGVVHGWADIPDPVDYPSFRPSQNVMQAGRVNPTIAK